MKDFQPMLATAVSEADLAGLAYPRYDSPKLDGIRAVVRNGRVLSRKLKDIPSLMIQQLLGRAEFEGLDGELITGQANAPDAFRRTTSAVMTIHSDGMEIAHTHFHVFDCVAHVPYVDRLTRLPRATPGGLVAVLPQLVSHAPKDVIAHEEQFVNMGFEGLMTRSWDGVYKYGRSTLREGYLLKLKRFADDEYVVTGYEERMHNDNELVQDERGYAKRSSHQANLSGTGLLGAWLGQAITGPYAGKAIRVSPTGPQMELEQARRTAPPGSIRKFKYFPSGSKDLPRFPTDLGPRHE